VPKKPLCTNDTLKRENLGSLKNVRLVQLVLDQAGYDLLRPSLGRKVSLQGSLFSAITGHHHADLLLDFKGISDAHSHDIPGKTQALQYVLPRNRFSHE
jgi:hypothetical protein